MSIELLICYHGTRSLDNFNNILKIGFYPDSWWAIHRKDAINYGGPYIFEVEFRKDYIPFRESDWQFHHLDPIPPSRIINAYTILKG